MYFSVLIPVYKTIEYIDECIDSILVQSFEDYEIVLVDDGSPDDCGLLCDELSMKYPNLKVVHKKNEGLLLTRRRGFQLAEGQFFICIDSDDYLLDRDAFEKIYVKISETGSDLLLFDYIYGGKSKDNDRRTSIINADDQLITDKQQYYRLILRSKWSNPVWAKVPSRELVDIEFDYHNISDSLYKSMGEDFIQSLPINTNAKRIVHLAEPLYYYRMNTGSISRNVDINFYFAYRTAYVLLKKYVEQWNIDDDIIKQQLLSRQVSIVSHLISSIPKCKNERYKWVNFVRQIRSDAPLKDFAGTTVKGKNNHYYHIVAKLIVCGQLRAAIVVADVVQYIHKINEFFRSKKYAAQS